MSLGFFLLLILLSFWIGVGVAYIGKVLDIPFWIILILAGSAGWYMPDFVRFILQ